MKCLVNTMLPGFFWWVFQRSSTSQKAVKIGKPTKTIQTKAKYWTINKNTNKKMQLALSGSLPKTSGKCTAIGPPPPFLKPSDLYFFWAHVLVTRRVIQLPPTERLQKSWYVSVLPNVKRLDRPYTHSIVVATHRKSSQIALNRHSPAWRWSLSPAFKTPRHPTTISWGVFLGSNILSEGNLDLESSHLYHRLWSFASLKKASFSLLFSVVKTPFTISETKNLQGGPFTSFSVEWKKNS